MTDTITRERILQIRELARTGQGAVPFTASEMRALCELALMATLAAQLSNPAPGTVTITREQLHGAIDTAMQDAWNEICADTGFHPLDIKRTKGQPISFTPGHWSHGVAQLLAARFGFDPLAKKS